nr:helix-turn-helix domain-containing protein [Micromonospora sp. DSM 115978]
MAHPTSPYTVSGGLLARDDFRTACGARDFAAVFRLMKKYDGASQDRIASPVDGLTQSRVSRIMRGEDRIASLDLIERIADSLRVPGGYFRLAPRPWEASAVAVPAGEDRRPTAAFQAVPSPGPAVSAVVSESSEPAGLIVDRKLTVDIDVDP